VRVLLETRAGLPLQVSHECPLVLGVGGRSQHLVVGHVLTLSKKEVFQLSQYRVLSSEVNAKLHRKQKLAPNCRKSLCGKGLRRAAGANRRKSFDTNNLRQLVTNKNKRGGRFK